MSKSKKFAVVLSGCGVYDGSEIHEATLTLYFISKYGGEYDIFAPDVPQHHVVNHLTGEAMQQTRNVLVESARIARGKITRLIEFDASAYDAVIFPGGFGAAKNLSTWAFDGPEEYILPEVVTCIRAMVDAGKPIGALCISPVIFAKVLEGVELTIGDDPETIEGITKLGAKHVQTTHGEIVVDPKYKLVTTPCYMLDATIKQVGDGAENVVKKLMEMTS
jgi:enhancing lycopene biosynthesis protein 2